LVGAAVALTVVTAAACGRPTSPAQPPSAQSAAAAEDATIPAQLAVPPGQQLIASLSVDHGSQVYSCARGAWTLKEPAAVLKSGSQEFLHTAGPQWISTDDGSAVTGAASATVNVPGAVAELLLKATAHRGSGLLGSVSYIQRLDTHGGLAPGGACADGALLAVGYSANYRFYKPTS
jgi:hypothetical protein